MDFGSFLMSLLKYLFPGYGAKPQKVAPFKVESLEFDRKHEAKLRREQAACLAASRPAMGHGNNGEETLPGKPGNFRKGLIHNSEGFLDNEQDYQAYRAAIQTGLSDLLADVPTPAIANRRKWESPTAGFVFDLEGPDAQSVTMPPAPTLGSAELAAEMAEVYAMAALRDKPFANFSATVADADINTWVTRLNSLPWFDGPHPRRTNRTYQVNEIFGAAAGKQLGRQRGPVTPQTLFRGITPGDDAGPLISQFLLIGNPSRGSDANHLPTGSVEWDETAGKIRYGAQVIDQRVRVATTDNFMTDFAEWLAVQQGANVNTDYTFVYNQAGFTPQAGIGDPNEANGPAYRFILTPRDLATYVHFDQLYQAYLNACLILLEKGRGVVDFDEGIRRFSNGMNQAGFAQFGGPHLLSLVTEVATRALKAVRYQKFNIHNRARPEAIGGYFEQIRRGNGDPRLNPVRPTWNALNAAGVFTNPDNHLLPMAFPEGSPMHPAYGAGHATVAGACVTILKAFFDHTAVLPGPVYEADPTTGGRSLRVVNDCATLTVEGELNKLASNISIGRNMAGVHYFSDYIESLRLGELIAIGILEEQALMFNSRQFPFSMTVPLFDGGTVVIGTKG
jgi:hypothetical protein